MARDAADRDGDYRRHYHRRAPSARSTRSLRAGDHRGTCSSSCPLSDRSPPPSRPSRWACSTVQPRPSQWQSPSPSSSRPKATCSSHVAPAATASRPSAGPPPPSPRVRHRAPVRDAGGDPRPGDPAAGPARGRHERLPGRGDRARPSRTRRGTTWRRPFVYDQIGYLFVIGMAMALFVPGLERRLGPIATLLLLVACGALGALAAPQLDDALRRRLHAGRRAATVSRSARWAPGSSCAATRPATSRPEEFDWIPVTVAACVLLLLPLVDELRQPVGGARRRGGRAWAPASWPRRTRRAA